MIPINSANSTRLSSSTFSRIARKSAPVIDSGGSNLFARFFNVILLLLIVPTLSYSDMVRNPRASQLAAVLARTRVLLFSICEIKQRFFNTARAANLRLVIPAGKRRIIRAYLLALRAFETNRAPHGC